MQEVSKRHPTSIARSMLYIAVCVQQLDPNFDISRLHLLPSVDARIDKYMTTVQSLITSDDDMISSPEGLECLVLQGLFHINAGNPRRAWLTLRRAINLGQLMGIHRKKGASAISGGRQMWFQAVQADRYLVSSIPHPRLEHVLSILSARDCSWDCPVAAPTSNLSQMKLSKTQM